jgi:hypothetical protein
MQVLLEFTRHRTWESNTTASSRGTTMNPIAVVILICSASLGRAECQLNTALDVIRGPNVANEMMCALSGQSTIAATAIAPDGSDEYVKIICVRATTKSSSAQLESVRAGQESDD